MTRADGSTGRRLPAVDALLPVAAVAEALVRALLTDAGVRGGLVLCALALATTLPLVLVRPTAAACAGSAASAVSLGFFRTLTVAGAAAQLIALYRMPRRAAPLIGVLPAPYVGLATFDAPGPEARPLTILLAATAPAMAIAGQYMRIIDEVAEISAERDAVALSLVEHSARGERVRISRELHDVVAHHISMIAVQAETARVTTPGMPEAGAERLTVIGDTARTALTEMRRLLGVLRADECARDVDLQPQPGLDQLNELLDTARDASGAGTRLILRGRPVDLDPGVELAAYRIVQEALTNSLRHAPGAAVDVELHYADDGLQLRIRDTGPGPPSRTFTTRRGHGLLGMGERARAVGGALDTGPAPGGGFVVTAYLPGKVEGEEVP